MMQRVALLLIRPSNPNPDKAETKTWNRGGRARTCTKKEFCIAVSKAVRMRSC